MRTCILITTLLLTSLTVGCADDSSTSQEGSQCELNPVTEANQFCASVLVPADLQGAVEKVSVHFFSTFPPAGPPSFMGQELMTQAELTPYVAGAEVQVVIENLPSSGQGHLVAVLYMPGGGALTWVSVSGVDYEGAALGGAVIEFTGEPINIDEPIVVNLVP